MTFHRSVPAVLICVAAMGLAVGSLALLGRVDACGAPLFELIPVSSAVPVAISGAVLLSLMSVFVVAAVAYVRRARMRLAVLRLVAVAAVLAGVGIVGMVLGPYYWIAAPTQYGVCGKDLGSLAVLVAGATVLGGGILLLLLAALARSRMSRAGA